jgi:hypothetical protein
MASILTSLLLQVGLKSTHRQHCHLCCCRGHPCFTVPIEFYFEIRGITSFWCERRDKKFEIIAKQNELANFFVCLPFLFLEQQTQYIIRLNLFFCSVTCVESILVGPLVTRAWRVVRLRMEKTASRYGG